MLDSLMHSWMFCSVYVFERPSRDDRSPIQLVYSDRRAERGHVVSFSLAPGDMSPLLLEARAKCPFWGVFRAIFAPLATVFLGTHGDRFVAFHPGAG
jgi:hypothetical protein